MLEKQNQPHPLERVRAGKGCGVEKCDSTGFGVSVQPESRYSKYQMSLRGR